ncbi:hypothetical protein [Bifidobacterium stellenboschense]|uniref:Oligoribonuclease (3'->5' exoribonuclease) n=1 Tax=Bifidobacterium stellenboschense TaxID=762211 RepID=A0A087DQP1_9BIFI|nr:hypothetical protein [Bifidobacterium stellenboschense]KFI97841.1 Oligoribonuclease (3'->5' exoribonuclease) [Bifidobacterium stellenboschense]
MTTTNPPMPRPDMLLWLDLEATGLGEGARILETGMRCTTMDASRETDRLSVVHHIDGRQLIRMELPAMRMHLDNGLLAECEAQGLGEPDAADLIVRFVTGLAARYTLHLAGTNPQFDHVRLLSWLAVIDTDMYVTVDDCLHYRRLDLTGLRLALQARGHHPYASGYHARHRVDDCLDRDIHDYRRYLSLIPPASRHDPTGTDHETE